GWVVVQYAALVAQARFPGRVHICRYEDIIADPMTTLGTVCSSVGVSQSETLAYPSWNATRLSEVYPWGTIRSPTLSADEATAAGLSPAEQAEIAIRAAPFSNTFSYRKPDVAVGH